MFLVTGVPALALAVVIFFYPIMRARFDMCQRKGFDAIEPDNMDSHTNQTGFPIQQMARRRSPQARSRHCPQERSGSGQSSPAPPRLRDHRGLLRSGLVRQDEPFVKQGKAVLAAGYTGAGTTRKKFRGKAERLGFDAILKKRNLGS